MENIISTIFSLIGPGYILLAILALFIIFILIKKDSIEISYDLKKRKVKIKINKKRK